MESHNTREGRRRAAAIYEGKILPTLNLDADKGRYVFMDLDSGDYEIGGYDIETIQDLLERRPDAWLWMKRVGYDAPAIIDDPLGKLVGATLTTTPQIPGENGNSENARHGGKRNETRARGKAIYENVILPSLDVKADKGRFVYIDVDSGDYEIGGRDMTGIEELFERRPNASLWTERVGYDSPVILGIDPHFPRLFGSPAKKDSTSD